MARGASPAVLKDVEILFRVGTMAGTADRSLLERFLNGPDRAAEEAFATLVERHGSMVLRTCRQILGDPHAAEDASQATFLVLARKASSIKSRDSLAGWLHGVAGRVAARAKVDGARRRLHELRCSEQAVGRVDEARPPDAWAELHEEIGRLPEKFRLPIVLCHLEGLSYEQTAQRIGCPVRTVQSRLVRGRERLRTRLARRGLGPAATLLTSVLTSETTSAAVSETWKLSLAQAALRFASDAPSMTSIPTTVIAQAEGVLNAMIVPKLKSIVAATVLCGAVACGLTALAASVLSEPSAEPAPPPAEKPDHPYRATMADGTTVEVIGVSRFPMGPKTWWRPDGSPLDEDPGEVSLPRLRDDPDREVRAVLIRVSGLAKESTLRWRPMEVSSSWGGSPTRNGKRVPGLEVYLASFPKGRKTCAVEVRLATGPWETNARDGGQGGRSFTRGPYKFYCGKAREYHGGTSIAIAENIVGLDTRIAAIDRNESIHLPVYTSGGGHEILNLLDVEFDVPPDQIREYQVQSRPFERTEIKDIAFHPRTAREATSGTPEETRAEVRDTPQDRSEAIHNQTSDDIKKHKSITLSRAYWADAQEAPDFVREAMAKRVQSDASRHLMVHGEEWFDDQTYHQYKDFLQHAGKKFLLQAKGQADVHGYITTGSITHPSKNLHEIEIMIPHNEYAHMTPGVDYTLTPVNEVADYTWKIKEPLTIRRPDNP